MDKMIFIHLPKTAGTAFRSALCAAYGDSNVSPSFGESILDDKAAELLSQYRIISGHISISDIDRYFPDRKLLTILREPIDRSLSWYFYANSQTVKVEHIDVQAAQKFRVGEFFSQNKYVIYRNIYNRQTRQLGGHALDYFTDIRNICVSAKKTLERCSWIGLQESLDYDINRLYSNIPDIPKLNLRIENFTLGRYKLSDLSVDIIGRIKKLNKYDIDIYQYAASLTGH